MLNNHKLPLGHRVFEATVQRQERWVTMNQSDASVYICDLGIQHQELRCSLWTFHSLSQNEWQFSISMTCISNKYETCMNVHHVAEYRLTLHRYTSRLLIFIYFGSTNLEANTRRTEWGSRVGVCYASFLTSRRENRERTDCEIRSSSSSTSVNQKKTSPWNCTFWASVLFGWNTW